MTPVEILDSVNTTTMWSLITALVAFCVFIGACVVSGDAYSGQKVTDKAAVVAGWAAVVLLLSLVLAIGIRYTPWHTNAQLQVAEQVRRTAEAARATKMEWQDTWRAQGCRVYAYQCVRRQSAKPYHTEGYPCLIKTLELQVELDDKTLVTSYKSC